MNQQQPIKLGAFDEGIIPNNERDRFGPSL
jgi:hypothetical protein